MYTNSQRPRHLPSALKAVFWLRTAAEKQTNNNRRNVNKVEVSFGELSGWVELPSWAELSSLAAKRIELSLFWVEAQLSCMRARVPWDRLWRWSSCLTWHRRHNKAGKVPFRPLFMQLWTILSDGNWLIDWDTDQLIDWPTWSCKWPARLTLPRCQGVKVSRLSQHRRVGCCILFAYHIRGKYDMEMFCAFCPEKHLMHTLSHISWHWNGSSFSHQITPWFGQTALQYTTDICGYSIWITYCVLDWLIADLDGNVWLKHTRCVGLCFVLSVNKSIELQ